MYIFQYISCMRHCFFRMISWDVDPHGCRDHRWTMGKKKSSHWKNIRGFIPLIHSTCSIRQKILYLLFKSYFHEIHKWVKSEVFTLNSQSTKPPRRHHSRKPRSGMWMRMIEPCSASDSARDPGGDRSDLGKCLEKPMDFQAIFTSCGAKIYLENANTLHNRDDLKKSYAKIRKD